MLKTDILGGNIKYLTSNLPFCTTHGGQVLFNICSACKHPLCPVCIKAHYSFHKSKGESCEIESAEMVRRDVYSDVDDCHELLKSQKRQIDDFCHYQKNEMKNSLLEQVKRSYDKLLTVIQSFYKELEERTIKFVESYQIADPEKFDNLSTVIGLDVEKVAKIKTKLHSQAFLKPLIKWQVNSENSFSASCRDYTKSIAILKEQLPSLEVNEQSLHPLKDILHHYVKLHIPDLNKKSQLELTPKTVRTLYIPRESPINERNVYANYDLAQSYELKRQLIYSNLPSAMPSSKKQVSFLERERIDLVKSGTDFSLN